MSPPCRSFPSASRFSRPERRPHATWTCEPASLRVAALFRVSPGSGRSVGFHRRTPALSFGSLQHIEETRSRPFAGIQSRSLRLQGLVTLLAFCSPRVPAGFVSPRRRSWDSPFEAFPLLRVSRHSCRKGPTCRSLFWLPFQWDGIPLERPPAPTTGFRPRNKSLVFDDPEGPPQTGCSPGFSPF